MKGGASYSLMLTKSAKKNEKDTADIINFQVQIALSFTKSQESPSFFKPKYGLRSTLFSKIETFFP